MKKNGPTNEANGIVDAVGDFTEDLNDTAECEADPLDWWRDVVDVGAGSNHGLRVGVISSVDGELVEIFGELPVPLKKGLVRRARKRYRDCAIEWLTRPDGKGTRYELEGLGDVLGLLAKRAELMRGGAE